jgi:alpha-N-arabinofuranosidase
MRTTKEAADISVRSSNGGRYDLAYATGKDWVTLVPGVDATNLSTNKAGGFVGAMFGPFAQGAR